MNGLQFWNDWLQIAVLVAFFVAVLFPAVVPIFWPWWRHAIGWNIVSMDLAVGIALFPAFLRRIGIVLSPLTMLVLASVSITVVPIIIVGRGFVLYRAQKAGAVAAREREAREATQVEGGDEHDGHKAAGRQ
jgi:cation transport ATPase